MAARQGGSASSERSEGSPPPGACLRARARGFGVQVEYAGSLPREIHLRLEGHATVSRWAEAAGVNATRLWLRGASSPARAEGLRHEEP
jgi:hypothetical protein